MSLLFHTKRNLGEGLLLQRLEVKTVKNEEYQVLSR